ncbi:hypothetical protein AB0K60_16300 [Thermopolyspora sp. NPDC052614]|uniref:tetratricopeptide repeat protein n=1 Tax=Thermopolyspora sp. NPDC052614 TaxID=3155682 RepID=UPI0034285D59
MTSQRTPFDQACHDRGWTRPAIFLAELAKAARLIGEPLTITDRQFRRWRAPNPPRPHPRSCRVLHAMFGVPPTELGFPPSPHGETNTYTSPTPNNGEEETDVKRRTFVTATMGTAAIAAIPGSTAPAAVGTVHLQDLHAGMAALRTLDTVHGSVGVLPLAIQHLNHIRHVIDVSDYPTSIGHRLRQLAGQMASMCGFLSFDSGHQEQARRYWGEALATAAMLNDEDLTAQALSQLGLQAIYENRPRQAYDFLQAARHRAETLGSPKLQSLIAIREARALAMLGDHALAKGELARGMRLLDQAGRGRPAPEWVGFYGPAEINLTQGHLYTEAGRHQAASPYYHAGLNQLGPAYVRNRINYRLRYAQSLALAGQADEAAAETQATLDDLPTIASGRTHKLLTDLRYTLTTIDSPTVRDAADSLATRLN